MSNTKNAVWIELYNICRNGRAVANGYYVAYQNQFGGVTRLKFERDEEAARAFCDWLLAA